MNRIKEVLQEKGITQVWLSNKISKSYPIVNSYVQNKKQPSLKVLFEISDLLSINPKELLNS